MTHPLASYRVIVNYWRLFYDTFCTFLHAHGNDNVFLRQKISFYVIFIYFAKLEFTV